jgi:Uma2 family endonuclease
MSTRTHVDPATIDGTFMSEEEYLALPEMKARVELVDGFVVYEPTPTFDHQRACMTVGTALENWASSRSPRPSVIASNLDIRFAPARILQPDVLVYCEPVPRTARMPLTRIPDLCVEIVSRRVAYDRTTKRLLYAQAGVRELWTVLRKQRLVERWTGPGLDTREECRERLVTPLLPGFVLDVAGIFAD